MTVTRMVEAVLVHYRSGGMLKAAVHGLLVQRGVNLRVHVVECGDDGSVAEVQAKWPAVLVHQPGANLGYCGGNNYALRRLPLGSDVLIVNPDVVMRDDTTVEKLLHALASDARLAAVAPLIRTHHGQVEYLGSVINYARAESYHTQTLLSTVPPGVPGIVRLPWVNGACWLIRRPALAEVGLFDERYFLFYEEVDWAVRAAAAGWALALVTTTEVMHTRSASFGSSTKGAYYYWRNRWLLFATHASGRRWRSIWALQWLRFLIKPSHLRKGSSLNAAAGGLDVLRGHYGPRPFRA